MDLALYGRVLSRHRVVLVGGLVLALVLAVFSYYRVTVNGVIPKLTPRKAEVWQSQASVLLTQKKQIVPVPGYGNPGGLASLASLYARIATSDPVVGKINAGGVFQAFPVTDRSGTPTDPVVMLNATGSTSRQARDVLDQGLRAFLGYVGSEQGLAGIPAKQQVRLQVLNAPSAPLLTAPRKHTLPIVVFVAVVFAAVALAFILDNFRRAKPIAEVVVKPAPDIVAKASPDFVAKSAPETVVEVSEPDTEAATSVRRWA